jgi:hypothetical protein
MKPIIIFFIAISFLSISCNKTKIKIVEPTIQEAEYISKIGNDVSDTLLKTLKKELKAAIAAGGFPNAIEVCNLKAISLTESAIMNQNSILNVKRTSYNFRNPLNEPDSIEKLALNYYTALVAEKKSLPEIYIQKITEHNQNWFRYYKPIMMEQLCLGCHGQQAIMDTTVVNLLAKLYPQDEAVGYEVGDFRGLISVTIQE